MRKYWTLWLVLLMFSVSCDRCKNQQLLPVLNFSYTININEPAFFDLTVVTGYLYYDAGNVKLIIYRNGLDEFTIYDARSTYNPSDPCICSVSVDRAFIEDPCSDSKWLLSDGSIVNGPAAQSLLTYDYIFDSATGVLHFYN
jgi:hypothetical protein